MAKRRSTTRRAMKRSAKRSAKRGAYKSRKTHLKSRGRTQRGGMFGFSAGTAVIKVGVAIANIIQKIFNAVFSLMVMVYILSTIARNPRAFAEAGNEHLKAKLADLRERMKEFVKGRPELNDCINIFESKIQTQETMNPPSPPPPESNVGKTCIYSPGIKTTKGTLSYQALIVGERDQAEAEEEENGYNQPMYLIWVNGGGLSADSVFQNTIKIVSNEEEKEFTELAGNRIGQQNVTMQQAREYYGLTSQSSNSTDGPAPPIILPEQQETLVDMLERRRNEFLEATDKKQFIADAVNGYIAASKLMLERFTERLNDEELKKCILRIKEALTQQIKSQVAELKSKLSGIGGDSEEIQTVFKQITALGQGLRDQFGALNKRAEELQDNLHKFLTDKTKGKYPVGLPSAPFGSLRSPFGRGK